MIIGKLYQIKENFWLLFPSKETAAAAERLERRTGAAADFIAGPFGNADHWNKKLNCNVTYVSPNIILFSVEVDGIYVKVVSTEGVGWIIVQNWAKHYFEEINA